MSKELEQLDYEDAIVNFNSIMEKYGCRTVLSDFRDAFPRMYEEVIAQIGRISPNGTIPALLRP